MTTTPNPFLVNNTNPNMLTSHKNSTLLPLVINPKLISLTNDKQKNIINK